MANLTLELNIYSAKDLENVNLIVKMDVYAVVWINGDDSQKNHKEKTAVDRTGGSEPTWNHPVKFSIDQRLAHEGRLTLVVKLVCDRMFGGKDLGEVHVPVLELLLGSSLSSNGNGQGMKFMTYQVRTPCGKGQGSLTFSYRFDTHTPSFKLDLPASPVYPNPIATQPEFPSTTYPPPPETSFYPPLSSIGYPPSSQSQGPSAPPYPYSYPYPPQHETPNQEQPVTTYPPLHPGSNFYPPSSYGPSPVHHPSYTYPPHPDTAGHSYYQSRPSHSFHGYAPPSPQTQHGHGYPPSSPGYGYGCPPSQQQPKNNKPGLVGLGAGAGLVGGALALGGLLLGDIVSDIDFDF